ncbi:hypothetical protein TIFTF001_027129 [Ficus carica]|uniref:Uncharacterized protein n=1 Tax=Ficus carica TaxID=3494 RepID=A0AA88IUL7_FICCA|nr:hypothetical protein TIFTF001_027129 [Ficus carica]
MNGGAKRERERERESPSVVKSLAGGVNDFARTHGVTAISDSPATSFLLQLSLSSDDSLSGNSLSLSSLDFMLESAWPFCLWRSSLWLGGGRARQLFGGGGSISLLLSTAL